MTEAKIKGKPMLAKDYIGYSVSYTEKQSDVAANIRTKILDSTTKRATRNNYLNTFNSGFWIDLNFIWSVSGI